MIIWTAEPATVEIGARHSLCTHLFSPRISILLSLHRDAIGELMALSEEFVSNKKLHFVFFAQINSRVYTGIEKPGKMRVIFVVKKMAGNFKILAESQDWKVREN